MGRPPSNGAPSFRFTTTEVAQMEAILTKYEGQVPPRDFLVALAQRFSQCPERAGKTTVQMKQVWNWFQNRRYQLRAKLSEPPGKPSSSTVAPATREAVTPMRNAPSVPQQVAVSSGPHVAGSTPQGPLMEFEAKSARDGAWYDVQVYLSLRNLETGNPDVLVRFAGFGPEEDEWVNVLKHVRQRSLPCEASECYVVLPGDLILCFQEGKEQALYYDAHVLDAQRRRHDVRGCRCRFLVRYDHDDSEEIVPLRKICRRPETDYRLQIAAAPSTSLSVEPSKPGQTSTITSGLTNPNPRTALVTVSPSPIVGVGPSSRPPAPTQPMFRAPAPTLSRASIPSSIGPPGLTPTPTSPLPPYPSVTTSVQITPALQPVSAPIISPVTAVVSETPATFSEQKTAESDNPAQISLPDAKTVETHESVHPAQIPVPNTKEVESDNPAEISVSRVETRENVNPSQILIPISNKAESDNQPQILLPDLKRVESDNSALVTIPVPEANTVETVNPISVLVSVPELSKAQTDIPAKVESDNSFPAPVSELNNVERDIEGLAGDPSKVESDIPVSAVDPSKVESDIPVSAVEPSKAKGDIPVSAVEPSKSESDIPVSAVEPSKVESDIPVLAVEPSKIESNIPFPAPEPNMVESDNSQGELSVQETAEIITPSEEARKESEIVTTDAGNIESTEPTEEVKE